MSSNEARQIVEAGLERKKAERLQRDAELEKQERLLRMTINDNHLVKTISEAQKKELQKEEARKRKEARAKARADSAARDMAAEDALSRYGIICLVILLIASIARLNVFVVIALVLGLAVFPAAYIYRLYVPLEGVNK